MASTSFLLIILLSLTQSTLIKNLRPNALTSLERHDDSIFKKDNENAPFMSKKKKHLMDVYAAKNKASVIEAARKKGEYLEKGVLPNVAKNSGEKQHYHLDPLLNIMRRSERGHVSSSDLSSSSLELPNWKNEWRQHWLQKKLEAINSTRPKGDMVNMAAARPWGLPCGDPNQHDMPWGTCMLPMECDAEYRIFRGDYFCGRTEFICCALQLTSYDMYQGFDVSFDESSLETDTEEKKNRNRGSNEKKRRKQNRERQKRRRDRMNRKRKIKRNIKRIVRQIRKILNKYYRNSTTEKRRKTRQLKKFITIMKKKYKEERKVIKDIHEINIVKIDGGIQGRLEQIKALNEEFMKNQTFRDIIVNGTVNRNDPAVRALLNNYPEIEPLLKGRRRGGEAAPDYLDYDIEYGYLYY